MRLGECHGHIHVVAASVECGIKDGNIETRIAGIHDQIDFIFFGQGFDHFLFPGIHKFHRELLLVL